MILGREWRYSGNGGFEDLVKALISLTEINGLAMGLVI